MKLNKWLLLGLTLILSFALTACSGSSSSNSKSDNNDDGGGKVTLNFWQFGATGYEDFVKEYMDENPNVIIKVKTSETTDHHNALFTALSTGSGAPDIAMIDVDQMDKFREAKDRFANLADVGANDIKDRYLDWKWNYGTADNGKFVLGIGTDIGPKGLFYRTDVFEAAGLPTDPNQVADLISTPEKFKDVAIQIKEKTGKPMVENMEMIFRATMDALATSYFDEDGNLLIEKKGNGVKKAYDMAVEWNKLGLVGDWKAWSPEWANAINKGEFAGEIGAAWMKGWMIDNAPDASGNYRVANLPVEFSGDWGGSYLTVPKESKNKKAAFDFISWLTNPDNQLKSFKAKGLFPSSPKVYEMDEFKQAIDPFFGGQSSQVVFAKAAASIPSVYKGTNYFNANQEIVQALTNVQEKGANPKDAWDQAVQSIKSKISR